MIKLLKQCFLGDKQHYMAFFCHSDDHLIGQSHQSHSDDSSTTNQSDKQKYPIRTDSTCTSIISVECSDSWSWRVSEKTQLRNIINDHHLHQQRGSSSLATGAKPNVPRLPWISVLGQWLWLLLYHFHVLPATKLNVCPRDPHRCPKTLTWPATETGTENAQVQSYIP